MECLAQYETLTHLLVEYGSLVLFILLVLGIIALPIPEETLLIFAGALMASKILNIPGTILAAVAGSIIGITLSYLFGRTGGSYLVHQYGGWVGLTQKRLDQAKGWFNRYGKWSLFIGYFIPGIRHFTGFSAGTSGVEYRHFALYAYTGGVVWIASFLSLGYFFGDFCFTFLETLDRKTVIAITLLILGTLCYAYYRKRKAVNKQVP